MVMVVILDSGSSPHTRGLRAAELPDLPACRIIPAHAGFTDDRPHQRRYRQDHPRTRGVYLCSQKALMFRHGSSPHTRGLRGRPTDPQFIVRIIPAHAGFTITRGGGPLTPRDHPRTRGVYWVLATTHWRLMGSSPHTRGLLRCWICWPLWFGIIPAHAGFTSCCYAQ